MERRNLGAGLMVLASSFLLLAGVASAQERSTRLGLRGGATPGVCLVTSLPSFVAQGEYGYTASVADVVEVSCDPFKYGAGQEVSVTAAQLAKSVATTSHGSCPTTATTNLKRSWARPST